MRLSDADIGEHLRGLPGWSRRGEVLEKQLTFASFPDAIAFVTRLAFHAEAVDHHPDLAINYRRVTVGYSTHSEGGITLKDIEGARHAEELSTRWISA